MIQSSKPSTGTEWAYELRQIDVIRVCTGARTLTMVVRPKGSDDYVVMRKSCDVPQLITKNGPYAVLVAETIADPERVARKLTVLHGLRRAS